MAKLLRKYLRAFWLDIKPASQKGTHAWYYKTAQEHKVGEFTCPRNKPNIFLNRHSISLPSKFISPYPDIDAVLRNNSLTDGPKPMSLYGQHKFDSMVSFVCFKKY